jgi:hypothetical protein
MANIMITHDVIYSVLGCLLYSDAAADKVIKYCKTSDFPDRYGEIFDFASKMRGQNKSIDMVSLTQEAGIIFAKEIANIGHYGITDLFLNQHIKYLVQHRLQNAGYIDFEDLPEMIPQEDEEEAVAVGDLLSDTLDYFDNGPKRRISTGFKILDPYYTISAGQLTVLTGIPMSGKSSWLDHVMINLAQNENWKICYFSPENFPVSRHISKLIELYTGWPFSDHVPDDRISRDGAIEAVEWIEEHFIFLSPHEDKRTLRHILTSARHYQINGLVIDPWNELEHRRPEGMTETEYISQCLSDIKAFSIAHNLHTWLVAHPRKMERNKDGNYPVPTPYDISGSAHFRNKADACITIHREDLTKNKIDVHIQKIRFRDNGKVGKIEMNYDFRNGRFYV